MTTNKPEVVAWRWRKPVVDNQGETVGVTAWELGDTPEFLPWWTNEPLVRLSDYETLQAQSERLAEVLEQVIKAAPSSGPLWHGSEQIVEARAALAAHRKQGDQP